MKTAWWNRLVDSVADRGLRLSRVKGGAKTSRQLADHCRELLTSRGEASGAALAREVVRGLERLDPEGTGNFLQALRDEFECDADQVREVAERYRQSGGRDGLDALKRVAEPPRQELFRRLNRAPDGTRVLVALREHLLERLREDPGLRPVDEDLRHLLSSWFNPGFLQLQRIDWDSSARLLEKLIKYESVHAIQGWEDLRRRLAGDRRCFGFFHPALPGEPLIFVEVGLVQGIPERTGPLLSPEEPVADPAQADTAVFFSISNCQFGLRGISFGNFLLKQVMEELAAEFPQVERFVTLSPVPGLARALEGGDGTEPAIDRAWLEQLLADDRDRLHKAAGEGDTVAAFRRLLAEPHGHEAVLAAPLERVARAYLTRVKRRGTVADPVARFHLSNGARLEQVNPFADDSAARLRESYGLMVNYRYIREDVEANHEHFVRTGEVVLARRLAKRQKEIEGARRDRASG
ncbi:malonyl-CoA decarboxylase [Halorhodospira halophila]|uniref:malonyl-CoA decarboxylase n=1 Tax=Halorhodospira halophila TaxID=1053 RepID=UPI00191184C6|nr:malonyl-CoA decarboxylase [Halorhodospira halophila]MBK5942637.1 hypothetical protein [Halorhodospira halophila]